MQNDENFPKIDLPRDVSDAIYVCLGNTLSLAAVGATHAELQQTGNEIGVVSSDACGLYGSIDWDFGGKTVVTHPVSYDDEELEAIQWTTRVFATGKVEVTRHRLGCGVINETFPSRDPEGSREHVKRIAARIAELIRPHLR
jgi:hypothetical protein